MGAWINSLHIRTDDRAGVRRIAQRLAEQHCVKFFVGPVRKGWVAVLADFSVLHGNLGAAFAQHMAEPMFHFRVADDDEFNYFFCRDGTRVDRYSANPQAFDDIPHFERSQWRGNPQQFAELFSSHECVEECEALLRKPHVTFESDRLREFGKFLGLSYSDYAFTDLDSQADMMPGGKQFVPVPDERPAARSAAAALRAAYRELIASGVLFADIAPVGTKQETNRASVSWCFDSRDGSLRFQWRTGFFPPVLQPLLRLSADWRGEAQTDPVELPAKMRLEAFSPSGRFLMLADAR